MRAAGAAPMRPDLHWLLKVAPSDRDRQGRKAGPLRDATNVANSDRVVAFWSGRSRGTLDAVALALRAGRPVEVDDRNVRMP